MRSEYKTLVNYFLPLGDQEIFLNDLLYHSVDIRYLGEINCIRCGRKISKSISQGYCYSCFITAPETEACVLRPELCRAHEGFARDMDFAKSHCLIDHIVYLSYTSEVKVGVTRYTQIPTRWIDQGAIAAIEIARTPNRYLAGLIEVELKSRFPDRTNWRKMLSESEIKCNLQLEKEHALSYLSNDLRQYTSETTDEIRIDYPGKIPEYGFRSFDLDKNILISDILIGIKGQYLIFQHGSVINIRKYGGYLVSIKF